MIYQKLREILPPHATVIEIGAHIGTDTARLARLLTPPFEYLAIEPDERNIERLKAVCSSHKVRPIQAVVGGVTGLVDFWRCSISDCNSLKKPLQTNTRPAGTTFERKTVTSVSLDEIVAGCGFRHIDLIWMDVQGAEIEVFSGATETLRITDYLYTECQSGRYEGQPGLKGILAALPGWEVILKNGDNVLLENKNILIKKGSKDE